MRKYTALLVSLFFAFSLRAQNFVNGQAARAVFGQYTFTYGGATPGTTSNIPNQQILGAASGLAWANGILYVADSNRLSAVPQDNRVVMFNTGLVPLLNADLTNATSYSTYNCNLCAFPAFNQLGQPGFTAPAQGTSSSPNAFPIGLNNDPGQPNMRQPDAVASDGNIVAVADTDNNRVLIWTSIPTSMNQAANIVLGQTDFTHSTVYNPPSQSSLLGPQGVWVKNGKLYVADTQNNRVLIWNNIPTTNNQAADVVLGQSSFGIGTQAACDPTKGTNVATAAILCSPVSVTADASRVFVSDLGFNRVLIWNTTSNSNGQNADVVIGQQNMSSTAANNAAVCSDGSTRCAGTLNFPRFALSDGTRLFVADAGDDRVLVFNSIPTQNGASADEVLGQPNFSVNNVTSTSISIASTTLDNTSAVDVTPSPTSLAIDNLNNLYVSDPLDNRVLVFTPAPTALPSNSIVNWASEIIRQEGIAQISGTIVANDTIKLTIGSNSYTYTVKSTDTVDLIAQGLVSLINAGSGDSNAVATFAGTNTGALYLSSRGVNLAYDSIAFSITASNTANLTATASGNGYLTAGTAATGAVHMLVEINGTNLSDVPAGSPVIAPLNGSSVPTSLGGVQVFMDGLASPVYRASATQVVTQIPYSFSDRNSTSVYVRTTHNDGSVTVSNASPVYIAPANPGIFNAATVAGQARPWPATDAYHQPGNAQAVIDVTGTVNAGDVLTIKIVNSSYSYTVQSTDTLASIVTGLVNAVNNGNDQYVTAQPGGAFNRVVVVARQAGGPGVGIAVSASASSTAKITLTSYTDSTCCNVVPGSLITPDNPAAPGETITLSATGLGRVQNLAGITIPIVPPGVPYSADSPNTANNSVSAIMGSTTAQVVDAGLAQGSYGVYQVQLVVPQGQATNPTTQVYVAQNAFISNTVTIPVGPANPNPLPAVSPATAWIDLPSPNSTVSGLAPIAGWAVDSSAPITSVQISVDGQKVGTANYGVSRPDVCQLFPATVSCANGNVNVGYTGSFDTTQLGDGSHTLLITAVDANGQSGAYSTTFSTENFGGASASTVYIDSPGTQGSTFQGLAAFYGWAINSSSVVTRVQIFVDSTLVANANYGVSRPDVCNIFGNVPGCPNVGWSYNLDTTAFANGNHTLFVEITTADGQHFIQNRSFSIANWDNGNPTAAYIDNPRPQAAPLSGVASLNGWALNSYSQIAWVAISVDGVPMGNAVLGGSRPDVCVLFPGRPGCPNVGWNLNLDTTVLADGAHTLAITVMPTGGQASTQTTQFQVSNLGLPANGTEMYIDRPGPGAAPISGVSLFAGWALNNNSAVSSVSVSIDGSAVGTAVYGVLRPDVCVIFPGRPGCPNVGWTFMYDTASLTDGPHTLEVTSTAANGERATKSATFSVSNAGRTSPTTVVISQPNAQSSPYLGLALFSGTASSSSSTISRISVSVDGYPYGLASYLPAGTNTEVNWSYTLNTVQLADGVHTFGVTAVSADGTYSVSSASFQVSNWTSPDPTHLYIDIPNASGTPLSGSVNFLGWSFNPNAVISSVNITIDGLPYGSATYGTSRPDVCAIFGNQPGCPNVGWTFGVDTTALANGSHTLSITATTANGKNSTIASSFAVSN